MKKIAVLLIVFFSFNVVSVKAESVELHKCIDGDTADLKIDGHVKKVRFLAVDTPETKHPTKGEEPFGKEASEFTCNALKGAKEIKLEYDDNSDKEDKYERVLAWVFVDNKLLQEKLIENGLAKVAYLYDDYKYTDDLQKLEKKAKKNKVGIWGDYVEDYSPYIWTGLLILIVVIICIFDKKYRNKTINKVKRQVKNKVTRELNKNINRLLK